MDKKEEKQAPATPKAKPAYTREALASSKLFSGRRDVLMAALKPGRKYDIESAEKQIALFLKGKVE